jgi:hypothetical protein
MSKIHYSEGEFPLNIYAMNNRYRDNIFDMYGGTQWVADGCSCDCRNTGDKLDALMVVDVGVKETRMLKLTITYSDGTKKEVDITTGNKYTIRYVEAGSLHQVSGIITGIGQVGTASTCKCPCDNTDYILQVDCSTEGMSNVLNIRTSTIRYIGLYNELFGVDVNMVNAKTYGATANGLFKDILIKDATIDGNGNVTAGTVVSATALEDTSIALGGVGMGVNKDQKSVTIFNPQSIGGTLVAGKVMAGELINPIAEGGKSGNGELEGSLVKAKEGRLFVVDADIVGCKTIDGVAFNPVIQSSIVTGGERSGIDMTTLGASVFGVKAHGGTSTGGKVYGGTAIGEINGVQFTIEDGITTGGATVKGIVTDGIVDGGKLIGKSIVGSIIRGGKNTGGVSTGGVTVLGPTGIIRPGYSIIPANLITPGGDFKKFLHKEPNELILWWKHNVFKTTLGGYVGPHIPQ